MFVVHVREEVTDGGEVLQMKTITSSLDIFAFVFVWCPCMKNVFDRY